MNNADEQAFREWHDFLTVRESMNWDQYFYELALTVAKQSKCMSRQIGVVLVKDKRVIGTGYNGPPSGVPHCGKLNPVVRAEMGEQILEPGCPRRALGYESGQGLHLCPATHAEVNAILSSARNGISVEGATMYMTCEIPCQRCLGQIINAGIEEIVVASWKNYDDMSRYIIEHSNLTVRLNHYA